MLHTLTNPHADEDKDRPKEQSSQIAISVTFPAFFGRSHPQKRRGRFALRSLFSRIACLLPSPACLKLDLGESIHMNVRICGQQIACPQRSLSLSLSFSLLLSHSTAMCSTSCYWMYVWSSEYLGPPAMREALPC